MVKGNINPEVPKETLDKAAAVVATIATMQKFSVEDALDILVNIIINFPESGCKGGTEMTALNLIRDAASARWQTLQRLKRENKDGS